MQGKKFDCRGKLPRFSPLAPEAAVHEKARSKPLKYSIFVPTKTMRRAAALHIVCNCVSRSPSQRFKMIPWLAKALFAVLDGLCGTVADAGHAVGAVLPPDGLPGLQGDVVGGAAPNALAAAGTGISGCEGICFYKAGIEDGIYRPAHKAVIEPAAGRGKGPVIPDGGNRIVNVRLRSGHDLPGFLRLRGTWRCSSPARRSAPCPYRQDLFPDRGGGCNGRHRRSRCRRS